MVLTVYFLQFKLRKNAEKKEEKCRACSPAIRDGNNAGTVLGDLEEHGHGEVEVWSWWVAPAAIITGQSVVWRAKVGGGDEDGGATSVTPLRLVCALEFEASTAAHAIVE